MDNKNKRQYIQSVGRRKTASARVRLIPGAGNSTVNDLPIQDYFPGLMLQNVYSKPSILTESDTKWHISALVTGGGLNAQAQAVAHGWARALVLTDDSFKSTLRQAGLITRDARKKERTKPGLAQAARAKKSSPKR